MGRPVEITMVALLYPDEARRSLLKAHRRLGTHEAVAAEFGVSVRTLYRVLDRLGLHQDLAIAAPKPRRA